MLVVLAIGVGACSVIPRGSATETAQSIDVFLPELPTLAANPEVSGSEGGPALLATIQASMALDYDPRARALEIELLELIGRARGQDDLQSLQPVEDLRRLAVVRARDMLVRDYFSHTDPETGRVDAELWIEAAGYTGSMGELIYTSTVSPDLLGRETYLRWMGSPAHRQQLLNPDSRWIGIGSARDGDWRVIVALFAQDHEVRQGTQ